MPVDYSKWDALELSDDSDIEVHPNVDKRSFIRARQNQIHQQRYERRNQIETLKYERIINDGLLQRIDKLLAALRSHEAEATNADDFFMQNLLEIARDPRGDEPPAPPQGVHSKSEQPRYSQMMAILIDQVKQEVGSTPSDGWSKSYFEGVEKHQKKVIGLQKELMQKLSGLEAEESRKITSDSIHTGFNRSLMAKDEPKPKSKPKPKSTPPAKTIEVLNPNALNQDISRMTIGQSTGADADGAAPLKATQEADEEELAELTLLSRAFSQIKPGDYNASRRFILENREVVAERETDALLVEAFNALTDGKKEYGRQCIHQGLLLQYCRSLGRDGVEIFFKRYVLEFVLAPFITDPSNNNYLRLLTRNFPASTPPATKPKSYSLTTSTQPTNESSNAPPNSPNPLPPKTAPKSNKSNSTPSTPPPKSTSTSPNPAAPIPSRSPPAKSSSDSPRVSNVRLRAANWLA